MIWKPLCARLAQSAERKALNLVVVGSSPTVGDFCCEWIGMVFEIHLKCSASEIQ